MEIDKKQTYPKFHVCRCHPECNFSYNNGDVKTYGGAMWGMSRPVYVYIDGGGYHFKYSLFYEELSHLDKSYWSSCIADDESKVDLSSELIDPEEGKAKPTITALLYPLSEKYRPIEIILHKSMFYESTLERAQMTKIKLGNLIHKYDVNMFIRDMNSTGARERLLNTYIRINSSILNF